MILSNASPAEMMPWMAFWSSTTVIAPQIKYAVGITFWVLFGLYFVFVGRNRKTDAY